MSDLKIVIADYKLSNLFSVAHALEYIGVEARITSDPKEIAQAQYLILPGVGAYADAMQNLKTLKILDPILAHINQKKPFMGVCLGLQLLFEESEEFGNHKGLGILKGSVKKLPEKNNNQLIRIPHIGWDKIEIKKLELFKGIKNQSFMYFVHSYFVIPKESDIIATVTDYEGVEFVSAVSKENIFAVQFHPEKSGNKGPLLYKNFIEKFK